MLAFIGGHAFLIEYERINFEGKIRHSQSAEPKLFISRALVYVDATMFRRKNFVGHVGNNEFVSVSTHTRYVRFDLITKLQILKGNIH